MRICGYHLCTAQKDPATGAPFGSPQFPALHTGRRSRRHRFLTPFLTPRTPFTAPERTVDPVGTMLSLNR
jgi:hypothetical protein